jgi:hypothetical protein
MSYQFSLSLWQDKGGPELDVTQHLRPGTNTVRFIQLADLSDYVFVLHAVEARSKSCASEQSKGTDNTGSLTS